MLKTKILRETDADEREKLESLLYKPFKTCFTALVFQYYNAIKNLKIKIDFMNIENKILEGLYLLDAIINDLERKDLEKLKR